MQEAGLKRFEGVWNHAQKVEPIGLWDKLQCRAYSVEAAPCKGKVVPGAPSALGVTTPLGIGGRGA